MYSEGVFRRIPMSVPITCSTSLLAACTPSRSRIDGNVGGKRGAVDGEIDGRRGIAVESVLGVVVRGAERHDLADGGAILFGQVLVDTICELVRLDDALAGIADRNLDELADRKQSRGVATARHSRHGEVQTQGNALVRVAIDGVVQPGPSHNALVDGGGVGEEASRAVRLTNLSRNNECLAHVHGDRDIDHGVVASNIAKTTIGDSSNFSNGCVGPIGYVSRPCSVYFTQGIGRGEHVKKTLHSDGVCIFRSVERGRVARCSSRERGRGKEGQSCSQSVRHCIAVVCNKADRKRL